MYQQSQTRRLNPYQQKAPARKAFYSAAKKSSGYPRRGGGGGGYATPRTNNSSGSGTKGRGKGVYAAAKNKFKVAYKPVSKIVKKLHKTKGAKEAKIKALKEMKNMGKKVGTLIKKKGTQLALEAIFKTALSK